MSHAASEMELMKKLFSNILYITIKYFQFYYTFAVSDYNNNDFITKKIL